MAKSKEQKAEILQTLKEKINDSKSIVFTSFDALGAIEGEELRQSLRAEGGEYYVAKKTLLDKVFSEKKIDNLNIKDFVGKVAIIFSYNDEVSGAKTLATFQKTHENKINFTGGVLEGKFLTSDEVNNLAKLPSKLELYAKITGSLNAPISGFVNCLSGNLRKLVYALNAIKEAKA